MASASARLNPSEPSLFRSLAPLLSSVLVGTLILLSACSPSSQPGQDAASRGQQAASETVRPRGETKSPTHSTRKSRQLTYFVDKVTMQQECCDGSAGVALGKDHFLVANDENSILRVYSRHNQTAPLLQTDLRKFLDLKKSNDESDLEGMTSIDSTVYIIASHSRSKDGDKRKGRRQLFALRFHVQDGNIDLKPIGKPYTKLLKDLEDKPLIEGLDFEEAARRSGVEEDGLNIEGLSSTSDGGLLIGFRTPINQGATILVKLANPAEVINGSKPQFSQAIQLRLGGMGIRSIERYKDTYLLATESNQGKNYPQLFQWDGSEKRPRRVFVSLPNDLNPESILVFPDTGLEEIHLLSDDGNERIGFDLCNEIKDKAKQRFRRIVLKPRPL